MTLPGMPFGIILVLAMARRVEIHSWHIIGKPMNTSTSSRKGHAMESKALAMSILISRQGCCRAWRSFAADYTKQKLS
jgi:hypothetical protein